MSLTFVPKHVKREKLYLELFGNPTQPAFKSSVLTFYRTFITGRTVEQAIEAAQKHATENPEASEAAELFREALTARV